MYNGIRMSVSEGLERNGMQIQRILNNYFFIDPGRQVFDLMQKNYFFDFLEDAVDIVKGYYDEYKIYMFDIESEVDGSLTFFGFVFCRDDCDSNNREELNKALLEFAIESKLIKCLFLVNPIDDEDYFQKAYDGELWDS